MNLENSNQLWLESVDQVRLILFAVYKRTIFTRVWLILPLFIIEIIWKNFFAEKGIYLRKSKWIHYYYNYKWVWGGGVSCFMGQQIVTSSENSAALNWWFNGKGFVCVFFFFNKRLIWKDDGRAYGSKIMLKREIDIKIIKQRRNCSYYEEAKKISCLN